MMKLYGAPPTRALRVIWLLNEPGLEYEMLPVDVLRGETQGQELRTLNPAAKVPVLVDGSVVLTESSAIQLYLALARQECKKMVAVLERHMEKRESIVGDRLSVADFNAAYTLDWANDARRLTRLKEYLKSMYARPTAPPTIGEALAALKS